jgi:hypothetical protein
MHLHPTFLHSHLFSPSKYHLCRFAHNSIVFHRPLTPRALCLSSVASAAHATQPLRTKLPNSSPCAMPMSSRRRLQGHHPIANHRKVHHAQATAPNTTTLNPRHRLMLELATIDGKMDGLIEGFRVVTKDDMMNVLAMRDGTTNVLRMEDATTNAGTTICGTSNKGSTRSVLIERSPVLVC